MSLKSQNISTYKKIFSALCVLICVPRCIKQTLKQFEVSEL